MGIQNFIFIFLSLITLGSALMVVLSKNPIYSGLYLILTMFSLAGHYLLLNAQFIAVVNIIVYAGAVMVLLLFVLMLLNLHKDNEPQKSTMYKFIGFISGGLLLVCLVAAYKVVCTQTAAVGVALPQDFGNLKPLGNLLFSRYVFPFEIASILFLAAIVGAVFLGERENNKSNNNI